MFSSGREAKEYLIGRIVEEAGLERVPLSDTERKMMYFTATGWTLPAMMEVNEVFEQDYDDAEYEAKIGELSRKARARAKETGELDRWKEAVGVLEQEDHYLLVLLSAPAESSDSFLVYGLKLLGIAILVILLIVAGVFLYSRLS
jgi:hypothetical protein